MEQRQCPGSILVPLDGSDASFGALRAAVCSLMRPGTKLHLVTVVPVDLPLQHPSKAVLENVHMPDATHWHEADDRQVVADAILETAQKTALTLGVPAEAVKLQKVTEEKDGTRGVALAVASLANELKVDLVVMASHGLGGTMGRLKVAMGLGGVSDCCLQLIDCPLGLIRARGLIHPEPAARVYAPNEQRRMIAIAMDGSAPARAALEWALHCLVSSSDEVHVICVADAHYPEAEAARVCKQAAEQVEKQVHAKALEVVIKSFKFLHGTGTAIVDYTNHVKVDMLVVGHRGLGGFKRMGSVSEYCANHCTCPVILHKPPHKGTAAEAGR